MKSIFKKNLWHSIIIFFSIIVQVQAQQFALTGTVSEANGDVIPGVTIVVKGTTIGTVSDRKSVV